MSKTRSEVPEELRGNKAGHIGPQGGAIKISECKVIFPPGAVDKRTQFQLSVDINPDTPEGYIPITPTLTCKPSMEFQVPVKVQLATWCSTKSDQVIVEVMSRDDEMSDWQRITQLPLAGIRHVIEFECKHFTVFQALVRAVKRVPGLLSYNISHYGHCGHDGNFSTIFHVDTEAMNDKLTIEMKERYLVALPLLMNPLFINDGESIRTRMKCEEPNRYNFNPDGFQEIVIDEEFQRKGYRIVPSTLQPVPHSRESLRLSCAVNDEEMDFLFTWPWETKAS